MKTASRRTPSLLLSLLLALSACGSPPAPDDSSKEPDKAEPLATLEGQLRLAPQSSVGGPVRLALAWYPGMFSDDSAQPSRPGAIVTEDLAYPGTFPASYRFEVQAPPPAEALAPLGEELRGRGALGILLAYQDGNANARLDTIPATGTPVDHVVGSSLVWTESPAYVVLYLDTAQDAATGLQKGFNLVKMTDALTSAVVPLSTPVPLSLSGAPALDAFVCEALWNDTTVERPCGIERGTEEPAESDLRIQGSLTIHPDRTVANFHVLHENAIVKDAQVTLGGHVLPFDLERVAYRADVVDPTWLSETGTVELRVVARGQELRRALTLPGNFELTSEATVKRGAPFTARWTASAEAMTYNLTLEQGDSSHFVSTDSHIGGYTFAGFAFTGPATLRAEAVLWPQDNAQRGFLELKVVREQSLTFVP
jgi:hypothetical protein